MIAAVLGLICLALLGVSVRLFYSGMRKSGEERILQRLGQVQVTSALTPSSRDWLDRLLQRAGIERRNDRLLIWLVIGLLTALLCGRILGWAAGVGLVLLAPLLIWLFLGWRYRRRLQRMIEQLPVLLDHSVRSLKAGRTLNDAVLGAIDASRDPLHGALQRVRRNVQMGVSLDDAMSDLAELYEQDELRLFALGLRINHRYGGNASELLENLIKLIREREQGSRQLRAMTGETRMTATVLGLLPVGMAGYFLISNPNYLLAMWQDGNGQFLLLGAFILQVLGCLVLWRMLRSI
ncbi:MULTISPECIES: type II secretion system F family protein [Pseudomonas]|nr:MULTISPECIES: type II secretion system F family protein [Pseudomonas]MDF9891534.1 tight adherence protein B [Pseudomonas vranovensis]MCP6694740.1 type II secretion system F family protein [Pseudomonas donghuensis]MCP6696455.1 type II secretion system F family protein [Pseudomonas donghuensis]QHF26794.1 type II secretion system protein F [Pseudomonas sp. R32]UVL24973.1 type II secretion system F family protein [Pseudomonas donghuensis]